LVLLLLAVLGDLSFVGLVDLDLAGLGLFRDRDPQGQYAGVVVGLDPVSVQGVAQDQLPTEHPSGPFCGQQFPIGRERRTFSFHGEYVAFDVQVDRGGIDPRQVEFDDEFLALLLGVHRHRRRSGQGARGT